VCSAFGVSPLWYDDGTRIFEKHRDRAPEGSIPDVLDMFASEVRFYREVAPVVGVRVPQRFAAEASPNGTRLVLEDLSTWSRSLIHARSPPSSPVSIVVGKATRCIAGPGSGDPAWVPS